MLLGLLEIEFIGLSLVRFFSLSFIHSRIRNLNMNGVEKVILSVLKQNEPSHLFNLIFLFSFLFQLQMSTENRGTYREVLECVKCNADH